MQKLRDYNTLSAAINDLVNRGYNQDFSLKDDCLECKSLRLEIHPEDFQIDEFYRFEGMSSTDDNSIVYAISSKDGIKGILVDAYGIYAENITPKMVEKLKFKNP